MRGAACIALALLAAAAAAARAAPAPAAKPSAAAPAAAPAKCVGTAERPAHLLTLDGGAKFCLRMPRYLPNPEKPAASNGAFVRTVNDTCGQYAIILHVNAPMGKGPVPHLHWADDEFFLPTTPGSVLRLFAQSNSTKLKILKAGEVPGWTVPNITDLGHADVPYGRIGYGPLGAPHTWRPASERNEFVAVYLTGEYMIPTINIPATAVAKGFTNVSEILWQTSMYGIPSDISSGMFGGPDFTTRALKKAAALPPATAAHLARLQRAFDAGEACFPKSK